MSGNGNILSKHAEKWSLSLLKEISEVDLSQSFKRIDKDFDCTYVRYLRFRLLQRIFFTNEQSYRMTIVDSPKCPLCNNTPETIEHAFVKCQKTHTRSRQFMLWLSMVLKDKVNTSDSEKIFGTA